jgi:hypothetical protein
VAGRLVAGPAADAPRAIDRVVRASRSRDGAMLTHLVLFRPKPGLSDGDAATLVTALEGAARRIPGVRRFQVGRQTVAPPRYAAGPPPDFPFLALVEVDDRAALDAYLAHPAHQALGAAFNASLGAAQVYDFDTEDVGAGGARRLIAPAG